MTNADIHAAAELRAAKALEVLDAKGVAPAVAAAVPAVAAAVPAVAAVVPAGIVRPNMEPIVQARVATVGPGTTRGAAPASPYVPQTAPPVRAASVGIGALKRPAPSLPPKTVGSVDAAISAALALPVTVESVLAAMAAAHK